MRGLLAGTVGTAEEAGALAEAVVAEAASGAALERRQAAAVVLVDFEHHGVDVHVAVEDVHAVEELDEVLHLVDFAG